MPQSTQTISFNDNLLITSKKREMKWRVPFFLLKYCSCVNVSLVEHLLPNALFVFLYLCPCIFLYVSNLRSLLSRLSPSSSLFIFTSLFSSLLKDPLGTSSPITYFHFLSLPLPTCQPIRLPSSHYYFMALFWHSGNNRLTSLFVSSSLLSPFFFFLPPFSCSSGFEQAAMSSQAHLLARANKTKATFPELNLLLRLSSVNWEFSSLKSGGVAGWLLAANLLTPLCVCVKPGNHFYYGQKGKKRQTMSGSLFVSTFGCREQRKNKKSRM